MFYAPARWWGKPHRLHHNLEIQLERDILDVVEIVFEPFARNADHILGVEVELVLGLRPAQQARLDIEAPAVEGDLLLELIDEERPLGAGADQAHIAAQEVDALRDLVQVQSAQNLADAGHPWILALDPNRAGLGLSPCLLYTSPSPRD